MLLYKKSKVVWSSLKEVHADVFTRVNHRTSGTDQQPNSCFTSATKLGVLAGSVAAYSGNYLVTVGTGSNIPMGLFTEDAIADSFDNAPATASNKIPIAIFGGEYEVEAFETHAYASPYASILTSYTIGCYLYCSPNGLLTPEVPTDLVSGALDHPVGRCSYIPTASNLILGVDLLI